MLLEEIVSNKMIEIKSLRDQFKFIKLQNLADAFPPARDFKASIKRSGKISLIAEVKRASPSAGTLIEKYDPVVIAKEYESAGAAAVSILTDNKFFQGLLAHLKKVKEGTIIPILRKDFILDELQILESRLAGADALLLIAGIVENVQLKAFMAKCREIKLSALVEAHDEKDVEKALECEADVIGINNRDLNTLKVDFNTSLNLVSKYPELKSKILVSESGISSKSQINELKSAGFSAVLIGESLIKSNNIKEKVKELFD